MIASSTTPLVLIADDEPTMLELVARHLKSMNNPRLDVIEASDGEQAWRLAREHLAYWRKIPIALRQKTWTRAV